jgi:Na+-driven multidrug efflux pump
LQELSREAAVKKVDLSFPQFGFVVATRAALGAGLGLLAAGRLCSRDRRRLGAALVAVGVLTTLPAAFLLFGRRSPADPLEDAV